MLVAGVDEVGRGPLAGPVIAAAVILDAAQPIDGLRDSKKLSASQRESLAIAIKTKALAWSIGRAEFYEIDAINILQASLLAMHRAVLALSLQPDRVLVDGNRLPVWPYTATAIVKGDQKIAAIAAASIIAKVFRDAEMQLMGTYYPHYGFAKHVGYATAAHLAALTVHGPCAIHRRSFAPVRLRLIV